MSPLMHIKLIGGPGHGALLKVALNSANWVWQHNGRNYFYAMDGQLAEAALDIGCADKPVLLFFDGMTAAEKELAIEGHADRCS